VSGEVELTQVPYLQYPGLLRSILWGWLEPFHLQAH
jgi:hypothetical protein